MPDYIRRKRKKKAREMRADTGKLTVVMDGKADVASHIMESGDTEDEKGKKTYTAYPTIFPKKGGGYIQPDDAFEEAFSRGEVFGFKSRKKSEKFASGSWKKGKDKKEAMKGYRERKKARKKASK